MVRFLNAKGLNSIDIHRQLVEAYRNEAMDSKNLRKQCREFTADSTDIHDEEKSGRPSTSNETIAKIKAAMLKDRRVMIEELAFLVPGVSPATIHRILADKLHFNEMCAQ